METNLADRMVVVGVMAAFMAIVFSAWRFWLLSRTSQLKGKLKGFNTGMPGIVLFTTPNCAPCKTVHRPMIHRILDRLQAPVQYIEVDASLQPDLAKEWGVVSVPTTYLLQPDGRSKYVHFGLVSEKTLTQQIQELI